MRREAITLVSGPARHSIDAEIAENDATRALGLMFRHSIGDNEGMLFVYQPAQSVSMWMRNTTVSLDMVFIAPDGTITRIAEATEPLSEALISSGGTIAAVLELKAGAVRRLRLKPGDRVEAAALAPGVGASEP